MAKMVKIKKGSLTLNTTEVGAMRYLDKNIGWQAIGWTPKKKPVKQEQSKPKKTEQKPQKKTTPKPKQPADKAPYVNNVSFGGWSGPKDFLDNKPNITVKWSNGNQQNYSYDNPQAYLDKLGALQSQHNISLNQFKSSIDIINQQVIPYYKNTVEKQKLIKVGDTKDAKKMQQIFNDKTGAAMNMTTGKLSEYLGKGWSTIKRGSVVKFSDSPEVYLYDPENGGLKHFTKDVKTGTKDSIFPFMVELDASYRKGLGVGASISGDIDFDPVLPGWNANLPKTSSTSTKPASAEKKNVPVAIKKNEDKEKVKDSGEKYLYIDKNGKYYDQDGKHITSMKDVTDLVNNKGYKDYGKSGPPGGIPDDNKPVEDSETPADETPVDVPDKYLYIKDGKYYDQDGKHIKSMAEVTDLVTNEKYKDFGKDGPPGGIPEAVEDEYENVPDETKDSEEWQQASDQNKKIIDMIQGWHDAIIAGDVALQQDAEAALESAITLADPYFKQKLLVAQEEIKQSVATTTGDYDSSKKSLDEKIKNINEDLVYNKKELSLDEQEDLATQKRNYENQLYQLQQGMAESGLAFSSPRARAESLLSAENQGVVTSTQRKFARAQRDQDVGSARDLLSSQNALADLARRKSEILKKTSLIGEESVGSKNLQDIPGVNKMGGIVGDIAYAKGSAIEKLTGGKQGWADII
jgi:hypothetical protein